MKSDICRLVFEIKMKKKFILPKNYLLPLSCLAGLCCMTIIFIMFAYHLYHSRLDEIQQKLRTLQQIKIQVKSLQQQNKNLLKVNQLFTNFDDQSQDLQIQKIKLSYQLQNITKIIPLQQIEWQFGSDKPYEQLNLPKQDFYTTYVLPVRINFSVAREQQWLDVMHDLYLAGPYYQISNCQLKAERDSAARDNPIKFLQINCQMNLPFIVTNKSLNPHIKNNLIKTEKI